MGYKKCLQSFSKKLEEKSPLERSRRKWEDGIMGLENGV
jgi:hypothetical protein